MNINQINENLIIIDSFWNKQRCQGYIEWADSHGFEETSINMGRGKQIMNKEIRNNERIIFEDEKLASMIWEEIAQFIPKETEFGYAIGLNERFRFYRYLPTMQFKAHEEGSFVRSINEWSSYTLLIYLNEVQKGGETLFEGGYTVTPKTGRAVIFARHLLHEGAEVQKGAKYVLRSDVMYRRKGAK